MKLAALARWTAALAGAAAGLPTAALADDAQVAAADEPAPSPVAPPSLAPLQLAPLPAAERPVPAPAAPTPLEQRRAIAGAGHGFAGTTALTVPAGRVEVSMRSLLPHAGVFTVAAGLGATTELSAEVGGIILEDNPPVGALGVGIKQVVAKTGRVQISVGGTLRRLDGGDESPDHATLAQVGGTLSACTSEACTLLVSAGASALYVTDDGMWSVFSLGLSAGGRTTRAVAEAFVIGRSVVMLGGVRFGSASFCGDLGLMTAVLDETGTIPYAGFSARM